jgi:ATP-dependent RNA helicase DDX3X
VTVPQVRWFGVAPLPAALMAWSVTRISIVARGSARGRGRRGGRGGRSGRGGRVRPAYVERRPRKEPRQLTPAQLEKQRARAEEERNHYNAECEAARLGVGGARSHGRCLPDREEVLFADVGAKASDVGAYDDLSVRVLFGAEGEGDESTPFDADVENLSGTFPASVVENIRRCGIETLTPVQRHAAPLVFEGLDVLCNAPTGSGKTAAFMLPIVAQLVKQQTSEDDVDEIEVFGGDAEPARPKLIVLAPTRELALQIYMQTRRLVFGTGLWVACAVGGSSVKPQLEELAFSPEIIIATPGRLLTMSADGYVDLSRVQALVLDEADRMLDMGFEPQLNELFGDHNVPSKENRQTLMFSATFPRRVLSLSSYYMRPPPNAARVICGRVGSTVAGIRQVLIQTPHLREQKFPYLVQVLEAFAAKQANEGQGSGLTLIFCKQKGTAEWLRAELVNYDPKLAVEELHGSLTQGARIRALDAFASGAANILVATDVAARGLDLPDVNHVINFDLPSKASEFDDYIHRIGRTGRAGRKGIASSLYVPGFARDIGNGPIWDDLRLVLEETENEIPPWFATCPDSSGPPRHMSSTRAFRARRSTF